MRIFPLAVTGLIAFALIAHAQVIPENPDVERVATGHAFTEGPALGPDGCIYFSDIPPRKVHRFDPDTGETTVFLEDSGGSNGLMFDPQGRLVLCEDRDRRVSRYEDGERVLIEDRFEGRRLNSPNDLVIDGAGNIYFSDPRYGKPDGRELEVEAVYFIPAHGGEVVQLASDFGRPNGVALSPDGRTFFVADNGRGEIIAFTVQGPEVAPTLGDRRVFAPRPEGIRGGPDGMTVDRVGNLYVAWYGDRAVHVWSPAGEHVGRIEIPSAEDGKANQPTNVEFAADGTTLYITAGGSLYRVKLDVPEVP